MHSIALNCRFSGTRKPTGTQTVAYHLFGPILHQASDVQFVVFADSRFSEISAWKKLPHVQWVETPFQDWSRSKAQLWEQWTLPRLAKQAGCDAVHHPITTCSLWKNGMHQVVTLHDLNFYHYPEWFSLAFRVVYALTAVPGIKRAETVVTISDYVRQQALESFHLADERLHRIYNGVKEISPDKSRDPDGPPIVLCVGSLQPHKNLSRTIKAFLKVKAQRPDAQLHIVGRPQGGFTADPDLPEMLVAPGVRQLGYLSEQELADAYATASVFCFPSMEEGFGLPPLEAMMGGTLVVTSDVSCLPETAGPAAELVDPTSVDAIAGGIEMLLALSPDARRLRIEDGRAWASQFTWESAARQYLELYRKVL